MGHIAPQYNMRIKNTFLHFVWSDSDEMEQASSKLSRHRRSCSLPDFNALCVVEVPFNKFMVLPTADERPSLDGSNSSVDLRTTVMMRNIPNSYTSSGLIELFDAGGFHARFDFVYLPIDFRTGVGLGYAFINCVSNSDAKRFIAHFHRFSDWFLNCFYDSVLDSQKVSEVSWAEPYQGLHDHVERYRNSLVMHESIPDHCKPRTYAGGVRVAFPEPTRHIRAPRIRPQKKRGSC